MSPFASGTAPWLPRRASRLGKAPAKTPGQQQLPGCPTRRSEGARAGANPLRATPFALCPCSQSKTRRHKQKPAIEYTYPVAGSKSGNLPWLNIGSAGWLNIQSALTLIRMDLVVLARGKSATGYAIRSFPLQSLHSTSCSVSRCLNRFEFCLGPHDFFQNVFGAFCPDERLGILVVSQHEKLDCCDQLINTFEHTALEPVLAQVPEKALHHVHP